MALGRSTLLPKTRTYGKNMNHTESLEGGEEEDMGEKNETTGGKEEEGGGQNKG